jgi:hypothetical protein
MSEAKARSSPTLHLRVRWRCSAPGNSSLPTPTSMESSDAALDGTLAGSPCDIATVNREETL